MYLIEGLGIEEDDELCKVVANQEKNYLIQNNRCSIDSEFKSDN
jgi:hypothetical protein